jgi:replicative DNA helicase
MENAMTLDIPEAPPVWIESDLLATPLMPHNRAAEEAVVGAVLINEAALYDAAFLKTEAFYIHRLRWIWDAFKRMEARRVPIDILTVADELEKRGHLAEIGGSAYLTSLISQVPTSLNAKAYARVVESDHIRRLIISAANKSAQLAYNAALDIEDVIGQSNAANSGIELSQAGVGAMQLRDVFSLTFDDVAERVKHPREVWGLATGIPKLDKETGGIQRGELGYLPGKSGVGKTWLMLGWGVEFGKQSPGVIISMEMQKLAIGRRLLSGVTSVSTRAMKSGFIEQGDMNKLTNAISEYDQCPVWLDDKVHTVDSLHSLLAWGKREFGWTWFILDYALLLRVPGKDEIEKTNYIAGGAKNIVQELDVAGLILHHMTKTGGDSPSPDQGDMRGSQRQVDAADLQLFLTEFDEKDENVSRINPDQKKRMRTLRCTKGREVEDSKFKVHLVRRTPSPFWGEYAPQKYDESPLREFAP